MHPLHDDIARLLADKVRSKGVVVWYDPRSEFVEFARELRGADAAEQATHVIVAGAPAVLYVYRRSMFELRAEIEPAMSQETPGRVVVYMPGCQRDEDGSVLMEAEKAGEVWEPQLKKIARNVLRRKYTDGMIDEILLPEAVTYADLAAASQLEGEGGPSILKAIFKEAAGGDAIIAAWLISDNRDDEIMEKGAVRELVRLIQSRVGLVLDETAGLLKARAATLRYVLGGEFRSDLKGAAPSNLDAVPVPGNKDQEASVRQMAARLRTSFPAAYPDLADRIELELGLASANVLAADLGSIDTFRFEEQVVFGHSADLIAAGSFEAALEYVTARDNSFWLDVDLGRRSQWEACRRLAQLGRVAAEVSAEVKGAGGDAAAWVQRYSEADGWMRLDQAQRRMEVFVSKLDDDPPERAIGVVRRAYDDACQAMADGFSKVLARSNWSVPGVLQQTQVYSRVLTEQPKPVAYFLVDAMRYEMGAELLDRLPPSSEMRIRPAVAALPSITPIGMAALHPGAEASFAVVSENAKLGSRIEDAFLPDLTARRKFAASRIPASVDMTLGDILTWSKTKLAAQVAGQEVVIVRSQEIDNAGEGGFAHQARQVMDSVIDDLARAIRRLGDAGIERVVLSADHGYLFAHGDRDESMKVDSPGGDKVELHRRCWIGRGGSTPTGCVRVSATDLGYASDLEFVFPRGAGVFRAGGDLGFHHGGPTLQEMVVPVITVRTAPAAPANQGKEKLTVSDLPYQVTNRIFSIKIDAGGPNLALFANAIVVKPVLLSGAVQVGTIGMATGGELDAATGTVTLLPGKQATVAFLLSDDQAQSVRIVIRDPVTDAELYRSPVDIPVQLGVG